VTDAVLLAVAAATGAAVMIIELMAVRLLAPWFGQTLPVWTNVIGVVLLALAVGQWLGGRWAEAGRGYKPASLLLVAGALSIALPDLVAWLAPATLPSDLSLEEAYPFVTLGSLLVALPVIGVPMTAMGAVAPWLIKLSRDARQRPGGVSGRILAAGTAGSLLGAFGSTYLLLGTLGSVLSVRLAGGLLVLAALLLWRMAARPGPASLVALLVPVVGAVLPSAPRSESVLAAVETPYQFARVVRDDDGTVLLRLNEGLDSFHSAYRPGSLWTNRYFDAFIAPALLAPAAPDGRRSVLVVGMGAGTMARQSLALDPALEVVGVEPDAALTTLGRRWFGLPGGLVVHEGLDGRVALLLSDRRWGAILVDAYAQQMYLPHHLCTREFFALLRSRLLQGGVAALNLGGRTREDPVVAAVSATFAAEFDGTTMARVPGTRNWILLGWNGGGLDRRLLERRLQDVGAAEHLEWFITGDLFAPVQPDAGSELVDGDDPVEALADAGWRGRT
jgi:spermidine synthase